MTRSLILMLLLSVASSAAAQSDLEQGGTIWFFYPKEDPNPLGSPMLLHVNILTRQLAKIGPGEYFGYPVPVGIHAFSYTRAPSRDEYIALSVRSGQEVYVEVHFRDLRTVPAEQGRLAVRQLRPISVLNVFDRSVIVPGASPLISSPATAAVVSPRGLRELPAPKPPPPAMVLLPPVGKSAPGTLLLSPQTEPTSTAPAQSLQKELPKEPQRELAPPPSAPPATPPSGAAPLKPTSPQQKMALSTASNLPPSKATLPETAAVSQPRENPMPPLLNAVESFPKAKLNFLIDGVKREVEAVVTLDENALIVTDKKDRTVLKMFSYSNIKGAEYAFAKSPRWKTSILGNIFFLDPKTRKHWFMVRVNDDYALLELDSGNFNLVLEAFEAKTGRRVETVEEGSK
jgi:hypothetical protein